MYFLSVPTKDDIKAWLTGLEKDREWLGLKLHVQKRTVDNWLSTAAPIPQVKLQAITRLMETERRDIPPLLQPLVLQPTVTQYEAWDRASRDPRHGAATLKEWILRGLDALAASAYHDLDSLADAPAAEHLAGTGTGPNGQSK